MGAHHLDDRTIMGPGAPRKACDAGKGAVGTQEGDGARAGRDADVAGSSPLASEPGCLNVTAPRCTLSL